MSRPSIKTFAWYNLAILILEIVSVVLWIAGIVIWCNGSSNDNKQDGEILFKLGITLFAFLYIFGALFSIFLFIKEREHFSERKDYKFQCIYGLIPLANQATWYSSILIITSKKA
ncbi:MAG: hypothetical protein LBM76_00280 [Mycoplasmataceae bacterium]|jgi:hypothetical protein|nr:hypothetical protein [Mycoplasmataceae bacterium]